MSLACISIPDANAFLTTNTNVVRRAINRYLALTSPWMDTFGSETWYANTADVQRSVVQGNVCANDSLAFPVWANWTCALNPTTITIGTCEYQYRVIAKDFIGPTFCVATDHSAFKGSVKSSEDALRQFTYDYWNAMNRKQALMLSGTKVTVNSGLSVNQMITRGFQTNFVAGTSPNAPLTWKLLQYIKNFMKNSLLANPDNMWGAGNNMYFKFLGSDAIIDAMRDEMGATGIGVLGDLRALAAGGFKEGRDGLTAFQWEGPYRGVGFGVDQTPLRLGSINADGSISAGNVVEPFTCTAGATGTNLRSSNPKWEQAPYEIGFLIAKNAIVREIPEQYLGEGTTKFDRQYWGGDVQWINNKDQTCNPFGDRGNHWLRFAAAYRPVYPQFIVPILYSRCAADAGLTACTAQYYTSGSVFSC